MSFPQVFVECFTLLPLSSTMVKNRLKKSHDIHFSTWFFGAKIQTLRKIGNTEIEFLARKYWILEWWFLARKFKLFNFWRKKQWFLAPKFRYLKLENHLEIDFWRENNHKSRMIKSKMIFWRENSNIWQNSRI